MPIEYRASNAVRTGYDVVDREQAQGIAHRGESEILLVCEGRHVLVTKADGNQYAVRTLGIIQMVEYAQFAFDVAVDLATGELSPVDFEKGHTTPPLARLRKLLRDAVFGISAEDGADRPRDGFSPMFLYCISEELGILDCEYSEFDHDRKTYRLNEAGLTLYEQVFGEKPPSYDLEV